MGKKRLEYIDLIKLFVILCVIWGHVIQYCYRYCDMEFFTNSVYSFIYSFHMPLFMTMSGLFSKSSLNKRMIYMISNKIKSLLIPCLIWYLFFIFCYTLFYMLLMRHDMKYSISKIPLTINMFWFINSLFLCYIVFYVSMKLMKKDIYACIVTCFLLFIIPYGNYANFNFMMPYFWLGYFLQKYDNYIKRHLDFLFLFFTISFVILLIPWTGRYNVFKYPIKYFDGITYNYLLVVIYRYIIGFSGSLFFLCLFRKIHSSISKYRKIRYASLFGQYTLFLYILDRLLECLYSDIDDNFHISYTGNLLFFNFILSPLFAICILLLGIFIVILIKKNHFLSMLLLGKGN